MRIAIPLTALLAIALVTGCAGNSTRATANDDPPVPKKVSLEEYRHFLDQLRVAVNQDQPRPLKDAEKSDYLQIDSKLRRILADHETIDELNSTEKADVFTLHEEMEAIIIGSDKNQIVCRRTSITGSHFKETTCASKRDIRDRRRKSKEYLDHLLRPIMHSADP